MKPPLRVVINAQLLSTSSGGVPQFVKSLVQALGRLESPDEEYIILSHWLDPDWLRPVLGPNQRIVTAPRPARWVSEAAKFWLGPWRRPLGQTWRSFRGDVPIEAPVVPGFNGLINSLGAAVVHFPYQSFISCPQPTIYNPHDLQHRHYPKFFTPAEIDFREALHRRACREATAIVAESAWAKTDIIEQYGPDPASILVIRRGAPTELGEPVLISTLAAVRSKFGLPPAFAYYPASTWPHKNHLRLLEAVHRLREHTGLRLTLVCSGNKTAHWRVIRQTIRKLGLESQVIFPGLISSQEVRGLYRLAQFVVFPSLFEGGGFPVVESFSEGVPLACAASTSLPEYCGDAALLFDPTSSASIAAALQQMMTDEPLREQLRQRGAARAGQLSWETTAATYRAFYRRLAGCPASANDQQLLTEAAAPPGIVQTPASSERVRVSRPVRRHFCTQFDRNYLTRGLALHKSLTRHCRQFTLWALCLDADCEAALRKLGLPNVQIVGLAELEKSDPALLAAKSNRSMIEYYFTCTPVFTWHVLQRAPDIDLLTHVDCDMYFFGDPEPALAAMQDYSIGITPHRFTPEIAHLIRNGIYNVGWFSIRNDAEGLACLGWWRERCLEWCYDRWERDLFADQKYLDEWPARFRKVLVMQDQKINVAPWNIAGYKLSHTAGRVCVDGEPLICYHFQRFRQVAPGFFDTNLVSYRVQPTRLIVQELYAPYLRELRSAGSSVPSGVRYPGIRQKLRAGYKTSRSILRGGCLLVVGDHVF